jgi:hypothetical protein
VPPPSGADLLIRGDNYWVDDNVVQRRLYPNFWMEGQETNCNSINVNLAVVGEKHCKSRNRRSNKIRKVVATYY